MSDNPQAFPHFQPRDPTLTYTENGMSLRDWFAGQAILAAGASVHSARNAELPEMAKAIATASYMIADAMLLAREQSHV